VVGRTAGFDAVLAIAITVITIHVIKNITAVSPAITATSRTRKVRQ
jgi:uncharacterized protein YoxC